MRRPSLAPDDAWKSSRQYGPRRWTIQPDPPCLLADSRPPAAIVRIGRHVCTGSTNIDTSHTFIRLSVSRVDTVGHSVHFGDCADEAEPEPRSRQVGHGGQSLLRPYRYTDHRDDVVGSAKVGGRTKRRILFRLPRIDRVFFALGNISELQEMHKNVVYNAVKCLCCKKIYVVM